jgi:hypothetical protein
VSRLFSFVDGAQTSTAPVPVAGPVRALEQRRRFLPAVRLPKGPAALVAGGLAGVLALTMLRVLGRRRKLVVRPSRRRKSPARSVVGTRSFLVDVHVLGR